MVGVVPPVGLIYILLAPALLAFLLSLILLSLLAWRGVRPGFIGGFVVFFLPQFLAFACLVYWARNDTMSFGQGLWGALLIAALFALLAAALRALWRCIASPPLPKPPVR
ncbi:MAG: hypothetical protein Q4G26_06660 [Paracoccus sp. (in: a-proteobacteria)]|nr:hypothetical protein [Paracoccus sp. (in: a-proteobacteria)]